MPLRQDPPRGSSASLAAAGVALIAAAMLLVGEAILFQYLGLREHLLQYDLVAHDHANDGETKLFLLQFVFGLPAVLLICRAGLTIFPPREPGAIARLADRAERIYLVSAVAAGLFILVIRLGVFKGATFTDDERVYVYEARALLAGGLTTRAPGPLGIFAHQFLLQLPEGRWAGVYPIGQPALLAFARALGVPFLSQILCGAGTVYLAARLAERLWNAQVAVVTALLLATSPFLLCMAATLHNSVPATFLLLVVLLASLLARESAGMGAYAAVGAALAALQLIRQLEALLTGVAAGLLLLPLVLRQDRKRHILGLAIVFTFCLVSVFVQLDSNTTVTGSPLLSPYTVFASAWPGAKLFGFGIAGWGAVATFPGAVGKTFAVLMRLSAWCFGWPASLVPFLLVVCGLVTDRWARACVAFVLVHAVVYFFLVIGAVHDIGSAYHLFSLPMITMVTAFALVQLGERLAPLGATARAIPIRLACAASVVALATFWPQELSRLAYVATTIRAPIEAAEAFAGNGPILLFWDRLQPPGPLTSWVYFPPPPGPELNDPVLWVRAGRWEEQVARAYPSRRPCRLQWDNAGQPVIVPL